MGNHVRIKTETGCEEVNRIESERVLPEAQESTWLDQGSASLLHKVVTLSVWVSY
jgi:hypothetical protein